MLEFQRRGELKRGVKVGKLLKVKSLEKTGHFQFARGKLIFQSYELKINE